MYWKHLLSHPQPCSVYIRNAFTFSIPATSCAYLCAHTFLPCGWLTTSPTEHRSPLSRPYEREQRNNSTFEDLWLEHVALSYPPFIKYIKMSRTNNKPYQERSVCLRACTHAHIRWLSQQCLCVGAFSNSCWKLLSFP